MKQMDNKNLELVRRITQVVTIIICAVVIPVLVIFLIYPNLLIPGYNYDDDASLYIFYTILFIFLLALAIGINAIVKRYIKRSIEAVEIVKEEPSKEQPREISGKV